MLRPRRRKEKARSDNGHLRCSDSPDLKSGSDVSALQKGKVTSYFELNFDINW